MISIADFHSTLIRTFRYCNVGFSTFYFLFRDQIIFIKIVNNLLVPGVHKKGSVEQSNEMESTMLHHLSI